MEKEFFWKDKSGRGFTNTFTEDELKKAFSSDYPEDDEDEETILSWAEVADIGDEWNDAANKVIRIK